MTITLATPDVAALTAALRSMREWPRDTDPVPLHPGDLGWNWRSGAEATAAAVRTWSRDGRLVALGFVDSPGLLRLAIDPGPADGDEQGAAVAATTVWSAAAGRPGLIEPLGVHRDHRGHGYGTAITLAAAAALRELGSSSAMVCTPTENVGGVSTYVAAGFARLPDVRDLRRPAG